MDATDLARRMFDNLNWSLAVGSDSPVFEALHPADVWSQILALWQEPDEMFVAGLYLLLLCRPADPSGLAAFLTGLASGEPRASVVRCLAMSEECRLNRQDVSWLPKLDILDPHASWGHVRELWHQADQAFVEGVYKTLLDRAPRADELAAQLAALDANEPRAALVRSLALSEEAGQRGLNLSWLPKLDPLDPEVTWNRVQEVWRLPDAPFVNGLFLALFGRPAEPAALEAFCGSLAAGNPRNTVIRDLALSDEARAGSLDVSWLRRLPTLTLPGASQPRLFSVQSLKTILGRLAKIRPGDVWTQVCSLWKEPDEPFVLGLYLVFLCRPVEPEGLRAHCAALASGASRAALVRSIALSDEARHCRLETSWLPRLDTLDPDVLWRQVAALLHKPDAVFVKGLYEALLGRAPEREGLAAHCAALAGGAPRAAVVESLARSEEAVARGLDISWLPRLQSPPADNPPPRPHRFSLGSLKAALFRWRNSPKVPAGRSDPTRAAAARPVAFGGGTEGGRV